MNPDEPYGTLNHHSSSGIFQQFLDAFGMLGGFGLVVAGIVAAVTLLVLGRIG